MQCKYEKDPMITLYTELNKDIRDIIFDNKIKYDKCDDIIKYILLNNGCTIINNDPKYIESKITEDTYLLFTKNILFEKEYNYVFTNGTHYIIVFGESFKNILLSRPDPNSDNINDIAKLNLGNSNYMYSISKICEILQIIIGAPAITNDTTLSYTNSFRSNPTFIAAKILDDILPINQSDIDGVICNYPLQDIKQYIRNIPLNLLLMGIRSFE